jgi:hypothetical protein
METSDRVEPAAHAIGLAIIEPWRTAMPRGDKSKYTGKQQRKADHIAEGY